MNMDMKDPIATLKSFEFPVGEGKLLPFINLDFPGQLFRWQGDEARTTEILKEAEQTLTDCGFKVERVTNTADILHVI